MINLNNFNAIEQYVLVKAYKDPSNTIIQMTDEKDKVLEGVVLSLEDDEFEGYAYDLGDHVLFNRAKSLPIKQDIYEEVFMVRHEDVFGVFTHDEDEAE